MANNTILNLGTGGDTIASEEISAVKHQLIKVEFGDTGAATAVSANNPMPTTNTEVSLFKGRSGTYRIPGRAGTTGQKLLSIHNATGSAVKVIVTQMTLDVVVTAVKAVTVLPPVIRIYKVTVLPTGGTALVKVRAGGTTTSNASVTILGDASADGTNSTTALTATLPAGAFVAQEYAARLITAAGYEPADKIELMSSGRELELLPLEGLVVMLDYTVATQNPITDIWIATVEWREKA